MRLSELVPSSGAFFIEDLALFQELVKVLHQNQTLVYFILVKPTVETPLDDLNANRVLSI
jgi:hypothetical protein